MSDHPKIKDDVDGDNEITVIGYTIVMHIAIILNYPM